MGKTGMSETNLPLPPNPVLPGVAPDGSQGPMTFGQILERVLRLTRDHFRPFAAIGAALFGVLLAFYGVFFGVLYAAGVFRQPPAQPNTAAMLWIVFPMGLVFLPGMALLSGLYYGAANYASLQADHGLKITAVEALRHGWNKIGRYTWLLLLRGLIVAIPMVICALLAMGGALLLGLLHSANATSAALFLLIPLGVLLYLGSMVYAIIMSLRLSLAFPACIQEGLTAGQAIKRSGELTRGAKGRIFLVLLVIYAISYAFMMVVYIAGLLLFAIGALTGMGHWNSTSPLTIVPIVLACLAGVALMLLWAALLMAAYSTAFAVLYRDQCLRKSGWQPPPPHIDERA